MKKILALLLTAVCLGSALSGCIVVPYGGDYHDHEHWHDHDRGHY